MAYDRVIATHYEVLGVAPDAPAHVIREAYRELARRHHPDRVAAADGPASASPEAGMAQINEAYRVLGDPGRRAVYDRSLAGGAAGPSDRSDGSGAPSATAVDDVVRRPTALDPSGPARVPWKLMLVAAVVGSGLVLISAALADSPADEVPDGIIRTDSCVTIEPNGDAREVACTGEDDIVVELLLPTEAECPVGLEPHRDRLGLGIACIRP